MTVKYLTGAYPAGYALSAAYTGLDIEATATVGGTGVSASFNTTIQNYGAVNAAAFSSGIDLSAGGIVTNGSAADTTALIEGYRGVYARGASATIDNFGTILGTGIYFGVRLYGGTVTNGSAGDTTALIEGFWGVVAQNNLSATIANFGTINGSGAVSGYGVYLRVGGSVTNGSAADTTALVQGYRGGVDAVLGSARVANYGTIRGGKAAGVSLHTGGSVTNGSATDITALIEGYNGVFVGGAAATMVTMANFGTIQGTGSAGVSVGNGGTVINGSAADTAALIAGRLGGVSGGIAATVTNFGTIRGGSAHGAFGGVRLTFGGTVINGSATDNTALIEGQSGVEGQGTKSTRIANFGTISGAALYGVELGASGTVTNGSAADTTALIEGATGVYARRAWATIANFGTISGTGVRLSS